MISKAKEIVVSASGRTKGILAVACIYLMIMVATITVGAVNTITDYLPTVGITFQDGVQEKKSYLVKQDTVGNVLTELDVTLDKKDKLNKDENEIVQDNDFIKITRVLTKTVEKTEKINYKTITKSTGLWGTKVSQKGEKGEVVNTYLITYANDKEISSKLIKSKVIKEPQDKILVAAGSVTVGTSFKGKLTTYGGDCSGCSGKGASGVKLSPSSGVEGSNSPFLTYKGEKYYCIAADRSIPFGTIVEISNHGLSMGGTIKAIVVDRGGAIKGTHIDIFRGSQKGGKTYFTSSSGSATFKIISIGSGKAWFWK